MQASNSRVRNHLEVFIPEWGGKHFDSVEKGVKFLEWSLGLRAYIFCKKKNCSHFSLNCPGICVFDLQFAWAHRFFLFLFVLFFLVGFLMKKRNYSFTKKIIWKGHILRYLLERGKHRTVASGKMNLCEGATPDLTQILAVPVDWAAFGERVTSPGRWWAVDSLQKPNMNYSAKAICYMRNEI